MTEKEIFIEKMKKRTKKFVMEANEINKIVSKAKNSTYNN